MNTKKFAVTALVAFALILFTGCASGNSRLLVHPETGKTADCSRDSGFSGLSATLSTAMMASCEKRYLDLGYVRKRNTKQ